MFEIQTKHYNLMTEYTELVLSGLKRKYKIFSLEQIEKKLLSEFTPIDEDYVYDMDVEYELGSFDSVESFIEDRIGEDFVVLDDFEDYAFCIHEIDDFITETKKLKLAKSEKKQSTMKELDEDQVAA